MYNSLRKTTIPNSHISKTEIQHTWGQKDRALRESDKFSNIVGNFNILLSVIDKSRK
jgi:hypothetical protein